MIDTPSEEECLNIENFEQTYAFAPSMGRIRTEVVQFVFSFLKSSQRPYVDLHFGMNDLDDDAVEVITSSLPSLPTVAYLNIRGNPRLSDRSMRALIRLCESLSPTRHLRICVSLPRYNCTTDRVKESLRYATSQWNFDTDAQDVVDAILHHIGSYAGGIVRNYLRGNSNVELIMV